MRVRARLAVATTVCTGLLALAGVACAAAPGRAARASAPSAPARELVYVATAGSVPVTAYAAGSHGAIIPTRTIGDLNNGSTEWDPWGVTFDASGHLYVQSFLSDATTFVFPAGAHGTTPPTRIFQLAAPDNQGIAVDAKGYEYVAGGESGMNVHIAAPGAKGKPSDSYAVPTVRTIYLNTGFDPWPAVVTTDAKNDVLVAIARPQGNAIEVFAGGAHGGSKPVRVIAGPDTHLGQCGTVCDQLSIYYSPLSGRIYAAVSAGPDSHISVFAGDARGDAHPVRTIEGPATGLPGQVITGITASQRDGTIYAMVKTAQFFGTGHIAAYARFASGNARPLWSFSDRRTHFANAEGIAITG